MRSERSLFGEREGEGGERKRERGGRDSEREREGERKGGARRETQDAIREDPLRREREGGGADA